MGFQVTVGGTPYEVTSFSVQEAATPLAAGDSSGSVGTITFNIPKPDPNIFPEYDLVKFGARILKGREVRLIDTRKGFTLGKVVSTGRNDSAADFSFTCNSRLGSLNVYGIQAQPYIGSLRGMFQYYLSLAGITADLFVDDSIASRPVVIPGWNGELWYYLKQLAAAQECDISLVSGVILLRPIRTRTAERGRDVERSAPAGGGTLAQSVEVYQYNNRAITNELVYPEGGWTEDVSTINVNAGEFTEEILELSASVSSIQQPVMQTFVSRDHRSSSVFTVVGDDGLPIQPAAWTQFGGSLKVSINEDTKSLTVAIQAPSGLPNKDGEEIGVYGISLSSDGSTGRYSTLRIVGSGVAFDKQKIRIPTGVSASETATDVGVTIDNPFLSTLQDVYRAGSWAARSFSGLSQTLTGSVTAINQLGDTGDATYPPYSKDQSNHAGRTYQQVQTFYAGQTYGFIQDALFASVRDEFENQVFGNVNGARVWDESSHRWYRVREGTLNPDLISFSADDDLIHRDQTDLNDGITYADAAYFYSGRTYQDADFMGLWKIPVAPIIPGLYPSTNLFPDTTLFPAK